MIDEIIKYVSDCLEKTDGNRYLGCLSIDELEIGNFFTGDIAFVSGIPCEKKKRKDGSEYEEPGSNVLRGGVTVVNGLGLIYDGDEDCWKYFSAANVELESRKKLSELYKEIDFKMEFEYA